MTNKKVITYLIKYILPIFVLAGYIHSAPPRNPEFLKNKPKGFKTDWVMTTQQVRKLQAKGALRRAGQRGLATHSTVKLLVIRVEFSDASKVFLATTTKSAVEGVMNNLSDYYRENSYGLLTVTATVTTRGTGGTLGTNGSYKLNAISNYSGGDEASLALLLTDAVNAAKVDYDMDNYDQIMLFHAGFGQEETDSSSDIWSVFYSLKFTPKTKQYEGFTTIPERTNSSNSTIDVICHEYGHQLGLPDLYDTSVNGGRSTCGSWSLMDTPYDDFNIPHLDPWSKNYLNWIDLSARTVNSVTSGAILGDIETSQATGYYKIPVDVGTSAEYFIVEYRRPDAAKMNYDLTQPSTGVIIWHIDDTVASDSTRLGTDSINTGSPNLGVDLVEADGLDRSKRGGLPKAKTGDMWLAGNTFSDPMSNAFNGRSTGIAISNIEFSANGAASFSVTKLASTAALSVSKAINYPNPAGEGYPAKPGFLTTIVSQFSRPPKDITLSIYNLPGELVKTAAGISNFKLNIGSSSDYKWIYEFDWNGKNNSNEDVAPGVYFFRIKADTETKIGKMAIVR